ncbi:hypothetical protein N9I09_01005 [Pontimonas sp.]|nr:hypothetical protein [Pontimonas sp.]
MNGFRERMLSIARDKVGMFDPIEWGRAGVLDEIAAPAAVDWWNHWPTWQVISPGRSGTRWLADALVAASSSGVVHATRPTLASVGFMLDQQMINADEAWGAYLSSRLGLLQRCYERRKALIDLDCKNSPLAGALLARNPNSRCLVMLRSPVDFIRSGLARGYFRSKSPFEWGHLTSVGYDSMFASNTSLSVNQQALMIAFFWNRTAQLAQELKLKHPERVHLIRVNNMFSSPDYLADALRVAGITISRESVLELNDFYKPKNGAKSTLRSGTLGIAWTEVLQRAMDGLDSDFVERIGLVERNNNH